VVGCTLETCFDPRLQGTSQTAFGLAVQLEQAPQRLDEDIGWHIQKRIRQRLSLLLPPVT